MTLDTVHRRILVERACTGKQMSSELLRSISSGYYHAGWFRGCAILSYVQWTLKVYFVAPKLKIASDRVCVCARARTQEQRHWCFVLPKFRSFSDCISLPFILSYRKENVPTTHIVCAIPQTCHAPCESLWSVPTEPELNANQKTAKSYLTKLTKK
jgi:hypothetical protein